MKVNALLLFVLLLLLEFSALIGELKLSAAVFPPAKLNEAGITSREAPNLNAESVALLVLADSPNLNVDAVVVVISEIALIVATVVVATAVAVEAKEVVAVDAARLSALLACGFSAKDTAPALLNSTARCFCFACQSLLTRQGVETAGIEAEPGVCCCGAAPVVVAPAFALATPTSKMFAKLNAPCTALW